MFRPASAAVVGGRYRLQSVIAWGGMGEIWRAHDLELDGPCAVKFILGHLAADEGVRARLLREAKAAARLRSPHAVQVLGVGEHEGAMYLAMELLEGETLSTRLARSQLLSPAETAMLLAQVAHALERAHAAGIVHRDLKPDNLWLCADHELFVKVLDFGVAKTQLSHSSKHTATGALVGTPHYMSPEQALAEREVDHRSDLWSLAIIGVECLTGKRPFEANGVAPLLLKLVSQPPPPLAQLGPRLPSALEAWWQRALQRDPEQRFQSANELVEGFRRGIAAAAVASQLPAPQRAPLAEPTPSASASTLAAQSQRKSWSGTQSPFSRTHAEPTSRRRRWRRIAVAGAVSVAAAGGGWLALHREAAPSGVLGAGEAVHAPVQLTTPAQEPTATTAQAPTAPPAGLATPPVPPAEPQLQPGSGAAVAPPQVTIRPLVSPLPPREANPWALPPGGVRAGGASVGKAPAAEARQAAVTSGTNKPPAARGAPRGGTAEAQAKAAPQPRATRPGKPASAPGPEAAPAASAAPARATAPSATGAPPAAAESADARREKPRDLGF